MTSLPHVKKPCAGCPFRKDTVKGWLGKERMQGILKQESFVCHKRHDKQCAGHMMITGTVNAFVRLAGHMGIPLNLTGQKLVFDTPQDCAEHHKTGRES